MTRWMLAVALLSLPTYASDQIVALKPVAQTHECYYQPDQIEGCGLSVTSIVNIYGCENEGYYFNVHRVLLQPGITYTFTVAPQGNYSAWIGVSRRDVNVYFVQKSGAVGTPVSVTYTPPTNEYYEIYLGSAQRVVTGTFRLTSACQYGTPPPGSGCVPTAYDVCLQNGRFRVSVTYRNQFVTPPQPGNFLGAKLAAGAQNPDVATFGISGAQAIEVVVRIQDARPFGLNRFDVYYGGLTDLEYNVTVTDTEKRTTRSYLNPPGTVGGGVDRTSFIAN